MKNAPDGGVFYFGRITFLQPHRDGVPPPPGAGVMAAHQPCRGRRPRRPFPSFTAGPTASQGLRAAGAARKGGTPGEGPPFTPSCAL